MPENLLCKDQKATTPAFREGWERAWTSDEVPEGSVLYVNINNAEVRPMALEEYFFPHRKISENRDKGYLYSLKNT